MPGRSSRCTMKTLVRCSIHILLPLLLLLPGLLFAQTDTGRVRGSVNDPQGALLSGANVTLTNTDTGLTKTATTDAQGNFNFDAVPRGRYKVEVQQKGFRSASAEFVVEVSQVKQVNVQLELGAANEVVDVSAAVPLIDVESSSTGEVIQGRQVTELPLNGRNFTQLALLTPGVTRGDYGDQASGVNNNVETFRNGETGGAALSVNGLRPQANNFILDGVDNNEALVNSINFFPPAEAIQEFRVNTSVAPAEFGRAGGGIVQTSIKSGENAVHGSAFWFIRNSALDANNAYFSPPKDPITNQVLKFPFKRNQFGGTVGLPIFKNKLFLFADYQGLRQNRPLNPEFATVPTDKMRNGDFSELLGSGLTTAPNPTISGCGTVPLVNGAIYNPLTCAPFPGNIIPAGQINQAGLNYLRAFPEPNLAGILHNFRAVRQDIRQFNDFDVRLDFNMTSKDLLFARYSYGQDVFDLTPRLGTLSSGFGSGTNLNHPRGVAIGETHTFGSTVVNDFRFGYSRPFYGFLNPFSNVAQANTLGIANANRSPELGGTPLIGGFNTEIEFSGDGGPFTVPQSSFQYEDTLSWVRGQHSFRFGASIIKRGVDFFISDFRGKGFFNIGPGTGDFTGYEVSELLAGFIDNYSVSTPNTVHTLSWETGYFAQDDWKVSRRLTLNLGLRYDLYTNPYEQNNRWSNFDVTTGTLQRAGVNGNSDSLVNTDKNNFAPRLGFAYDLAGEGKTVLRGGYGIFYFLDRGGVGNQLSANPDWSGAISLQASDGARVTLSGQGPTGNNNNQLATQALPLPTITVNDAHPTNTSVIAIFPNNPTSTVQQANLQIGQQLGRNTALNVAWVGTKADHLMTWFNYTNQQLATNSALFPGRGLNVTAGGAFGTSHYSGLQTQLLQRMSHGLQYTVAYTWSHATDDSNGAFSINTNSPIFVDASGHVLLSQNKGNSDTDQRHAFVFSSLYELPIGRGKKFGSDWNGLVNNVFGGWQFNNIVSLGTGTPFDITINGVRPDILGSVSTGSLQLVNGQREWISVAPGTLVAPPKDANGKFIRPGTLGRNQFYGPGYGTWDASLFKNFTLTERVKLQFRAEGFNILNHPQYANPNANLDSGLPSLSSNNSFGLINATRQFSERQIQFAFRFTF